MNRRFAERFSSQWVKVRFYEKEPRLNGVLKPASVRFCEAIKMAVSQPVLLSKENLSCASAQYVFGWTDLDSARLLNTCHAKSEIHDAHLQSLLSAVSRLDKPVSHIGLNTDGEPDLVIACVAPQEMMHIIKDYNSRTGKNIEVSLSSTAGLCGAVAARSFLEEEIAISFGCTDSRKLAGMNRDRLAVGVPQRLFSLFVK